MNEGTAMGAVWWLLSLYYMTFVGFVFAILSIVFGVAGLKGQYRKLAIASLCIKGLTIIIFLLLTIVPLFILNR